MSDCPPGCLVNFNESYKFQWWLALSRASLHFDYDSVYSLAENLTFLLAASRPQLLAPLVVNFFACGKI